MQKTTNTTDNQGAGRRIAVIGAGAAGLSTAYFLKENGFRNVTVFEKSKRVGGLCETITYNNESFDLGANYITPAYKTVLDLAEKMGAETVRGPQRRLVTQPPSTIIRHLGSLLPWHSLRKLIGVARAAIRFLWYRRRFSKVMETPGLAGIADYPELNKPLGTWLDDNRMGELRKLLIAPVTIFGYGNIDEVPAAYVLKYFSSKTFAAAVYAALAINNWPEWFPLSKKFNWPRRFKYGYQDLWERVANTLNVELNVHIDKIERGTGGILISIAGIPEPRRFDDVILACPLDDKSLEGFLDLSDKEKEIFEKVQYRDYAVTLWKKENFRGMDMPYRILLDCDLEKPGDPWGIARIWCESNLVIFYNVLNDAVDDDGQAVTDMNDTDAEAFVRQRINDFIAEPKNAKIRRPKEFRRHRNYFPHFRQEDLDNGVYQTIEDMQGQNNTYYVGGLLAFELVETISNYSQQVADKIAEKHSRESVPEPAPEHPRIGIIGAGAGGLSAAYYLQKEGYRDITILEKSERVGGKCCTIEYSDRCYELGAIDVLWGYKEIISMAKEVKAKMAANQRAMLFNRKLRKKELILTEVFRGEPWLGVAAAGIRFLWQLFRHRKWVGQPGMANIPRDLEMSFLTWLEHHRMMPIRKVFILPIIACGYGHYRDISAGYVMKFLRLHNIASCVIGAVISQFERKPEIEDPPPPLFAHTCRSFWEKVAVRRSNFSKKFWHYIAVRQLAKDKLSWPRQFEIGFQGFWEEVTKRMQDLERVRFPLKLIHNATIRKITRGDEISVKTKIGAGKDVAEKNYTFDKLIVACPLDAGSLSFMDLKPRERFLFEAITTDIYWAHVCKITDFDESSFLGQYPTPRDGSPLGIIKQWPKVDAAVFYSPTYLTPKRNAPLQSDLPDEEELVIRAIREEAGLIGANFQGVVTLKVGNKDVRQSKKWPYFPHVNPGQLESGYHDKFESIQEQNNTYYIGGFANFETVDSTVKYSRGIIEKFFSKNNRS